MPTVFSPASIPQKRSYDRTRWAFALDGKGEPRRDPTLKHPRCVFQLLKQHFSRYNAEEVCRITGTPKENYLRICDLYTSTFAPDRAGTWLYAMGTAQHSHGTQNIRSYAILQLLLGNIGVAGGGVNAMRGESNVQGSRSGAEQRWLAGLSQDAHRSGRRLKKLFETGNSGGCECGERELAAEHAEVCRQSAESVVGGARHHARMSSTSPTCRSSAADFKDRATRFSRSPTPCSPAK